MKTAIFPGSFDPSTLGHKDIIEKSLNIFDSVIIGIGQNSEKKYMFSAERRKQFVEETFRLSLGLKKYPIPIIPVPKIILSIFLRIVFFMLTLLVHCNLF